MKHLTNHNDSEKKKKSSGDVYTSSVEMHACFLSLGPPVSSLSLESLIPHQPIGSRAVTPLGKGGDERRSDLTTLAWQVQSRER